MQSFPRARFGLSRALDVDFVPSRGNFVLVDVGCPAHSVFDALLHRGIIVRPMAGHGLPNHLRVSIGTEEENALFLDALGAVLRETAEVPT